MSIKQMSRRENMQLTDARREIPGYGDNPPAWTVIEMAAWLSGQLGREVSFAQASNFARDADVTLLPRKPTRRVMDSGNKFIGHCLADLFAAVGQPVPRHLSDWLMHKVTLDEAADMRADTAPHQAPINFADATQSSPSLGLVGENSPSDANGHDAAPRDPKW